MVPVTKVLLPYGRPLASSAEAAGNSGVYKVLPKEEGDRDGSEFPPDGLRSRTCENRNRTPQGQNGLQSPPLPVTSHELGHVWALDSREI